MNEAKKKKRKRRRTTLWLNLIFREGVFAIGLSGVKPEDEDKVNNIKYLLLYC